MHLKEKEWAAFLRLHSTPGVGPQKLRILVNYCGSARAVLQKSKRVLMSIRGIDEKTAISILEYDSSDFVEQQLRRMTACSTSLMTIWDDDYPQALKQIYDPPPMLFVRGTLLPQDRFAVGIVGMRQPSVYGKLVTQQIASKLLERKLNIISGLAYGIDTIAHETAVKLAGRTIAVLGSGVDNIYPPENRALAQKIIDRGAVISEFPMATEPDRGNFPRRNRIISGMSLGIVVVEAGEKSGALLTADFAVEQNREVFAVPGNINSPRSIGPNSLIKQGATPVTSPEDILTELAPKLTHCGNSEVGASAPSVDLHENEQSIYNLLHSEPRHIDWIARSAKQPTGKVLSVLLTLELKGLVRQETGKLFLRL